MTCERVWIKHESGLSSVFFIPNKCKPCTNISRKASVRGVTVKKGHPYHCDKTYTELVYFL